MIEDVLILWGTLATLAALALLERWLRARRWRDLYRTRCHEMMRDDEEESARWAAAIEARVRREERAACIEVCRSAFAAAARDTVRRRMTGDAEGREVDCAWFRGMQAGAEAVEEAIRTRGKDGA